MPGGKTREGPYGPYPNTGEWKEPFLASLRECPNVLKAAKAAGTSRRNVYKARKNSKTFAAAWDEAFQEGIDKIEGVAMSNALDSDPKNNSMRMFMLKAWRPERYKETVQNEITGKDGGDVVVKILRGVSVDDL